MVDHLPAATMDEKRSHFMWKVNIITGPHVYEMEPQNRQKFADWIHRNHFTVAENEEFNEDTKVMDPHFSSTQEPKSDWMCFRLISN